MKVRRIKSRAKRIASALQFTNLSDCTAQRLYETFVTDFADEVKGNLLIKELSKPVLKVIIGGKK